MNYLFPITSEKKEQKNVGGLRNEGSKSFHWIEQIRHSILSHPHNRYASLIAPQNGPLVEMSCHTHSCFGNIKTVWGPEWDGAGMA